MAESEPSDSQALVSFQDVHFGFNNRNIFSGLELEIPRGKVTTIMGPSGTGKTTALRLLSGQIKPTSGRVLVDGQSVPDMSRKTLYAMRQNMGMMFQSGALFNDLNVFENVAFPLREHTQLSEAMLRDIVLLKLEAVGLRGASQLRTSELSGGMARRVAMARAIALDPDIMMYDEPFVGLDPITVGVIMKLIRQLNDSLGMTSIIVSHDVAEVTAISDYLYIIAEGRVIGSGQPGELQEQGSDWVKQFLSGAPDGPAPFHYPATDLAEDLLAGARK